MPTPATHFHQRRKQQRRAKRKRRLLRCTRQIPDYRQELDWLFGHQGTVMDIDYTPDGNFLVSCSSDGTVKVWDVATKRVVRDFTGHGKNVSAVRVSPDGKLIASGSGGWEDQRSGNNRNLAARNRRNTPERSTGTLAAITQLRFTSDGKRLVSVSGHQTYQKGEINIWDVETRPNLKQVRGPVARRSRDWIYRRMIASSRRVAGNGQIHLWDVSSGEHVTSIGTAGRSLLFSHIFRRRQAVWRPAATRRLRSMTRLGKRRVEEVRPCGAVKDVSFANENRLISCSLDGSARLWDVASGENLLTLRDLHLGTCTALE